VCVLLATSYALEDHLQCDFDSGVLCFNLVQDAYPSDTFDWTLDRNGTDSKYTGPDVDHTRGNASGWYLYIETSDPQVSGSF